MFNYSISKHFKVWDIKVVYLEKGLVTDVSDYRSIISGGFVCSCDCLRVRAGSKLGKNLFALPWRATSKVQKNICLSFAGRIQVLEIMRGAECYFGGALNPEQLNVGGGTDH